jgi:hypothetical protein
MYKLVIFSLFFILCFISCKKSESTVKPEDVFIFEPNDYSWDGSWIPTEFPLDNMLDDVYNTEGVYTLEGNIPSPILPPGEWDWETTTSMANYRNFSSNMGTFEALLDQDNNQYGWKFIPLDPGGTDVASGMSFFEGSSGLNVINLGNNGQVHSTGDINFGNGLTMLRFKESWSLDLRTGSSENANIGNDNDLVLAGSDSPISSGEFEVETTTIHTGPGRDLVFVNNMQQAAIDLGNGANGRTDAIDPNDRGDMVIIDGNQYDCRFFGGAGDDIFIWYINNSHHSNAWIGSNLYGTGGYGEAQWTNDTDRLIFVLPDDTPVVGSEVGSTPNGSVKLWQQNPFPANQEDEPMAGQVYARYHTAYTNNEGRRTMLIEYRTPDGNTTTGYMSLVSFEELQVGIGENAKVYKIDDKTGTFEYDPELVPLYEDEIPRKESYRSLFDRF